MLPMFVFWNESSLFTTTAIISHDEWWVDMSWQMPHSVAICSSNPGPGLKDSPFPGALLVASSEFFPDSPGLSLSSRRIAPIYRVVVGTLRHAGGGFGGVMGYNLLHILITYLSSHKGGSEKRSFWRLNSLSRVSCFASMCLRKVRYCMNGWPYYCGSMFMNDRISWRRGRKPWLICNRLSWR